MVGLNYIFYSVVVPCFMVFGSEGDITLKQVWSNYCSDGGSDSNDSNNNSNDSNKDKKTINNTNNSSQTENTNTSGQTNNMNPRSFTPSGSAAAGGGALGAAIVHATSGMSLPVIVGLGVVVVGTTATGLFAVAEGIGQHTVNNYYQNQSSTGSQEANQSQANVANSSNNPIEGDEAITPQSTSAPSRSIEPNNVSTQTSQVDISETSVEKKDTLNKLDGSDETFSPDSSMIMSPLEPSADSAPLEALIGYLLSLNVIDLTLTICLLIVIFDRFFYRISLEKINLFISNNKYFPNFFKKWFSKYTIRSVNVTNIFTLVMFIVIALLFIFSKLLGLFISYELYNNLEDYVVVYNYLKNISKSSICLFIISSNPLLSKFFLKNHPQNYSPYKFSFIKSKKRQKY